MRLFILDAGGVLKDSKKAVLSAMRTALDTFNIHWKWSDDAAWQMRGLSKYGDPKEAFKALVAISIGYANLDNIMQQKNPEEEIQLIVDSFLTADYEGMAIEITDAYRKIRETEENKKLTHVFNYSKEALDILSKKFKLAMVTNIKRTRLEEELKELDLTKFTLIVSADDVHNLKPHPEGILKVCGAIGIKPAEAAMIGDSAWDIRAAKAAGCKAIAVLTGMSRRSDMEREGADLIFNNILEVAHYFCK